MTQVNALIPLSVKQAQPFTAYAQGANMNEQNRLNAIKGRYMEAQTNVLNQKANQPKQWNAAQLKVAREVAHQLLTHYDTYKNDPDAQQKWQQDYQGAIRWMGSTGIPVDQLPPTATPDEVANFAITYDKHAPERREVKSGDKIITEEWNNGKWNKVAEAPRFQPKMEKKEYVYQTNVGPMSQRHAIDLYKQKYHKPNLSLSIGADGTINTGGDKQEAASFHDFLINELGVQGLPTIKSNDKALNAAKNQGLTILGQ